MSKKPLLPFDLEEELDHDYLVELAQLQLELLKLQDHVRAQGHRLLVIFEGRDAAGTGGAILRFTQNLNPRHVRTIALAKPTPVETGQWYFQRYLRGLPDPGEIVLFDRSWYNRAVVEPVFGFCSEDQRQRFLAQVVDVERMLVEDGIVLVKLWFSIDRAVQKERLEARVRNPLRRWKLSPVDQAAQAHWDSFTRYKEAMFSRTSSEVAPWTIVRGNVKKRARLEAIRHVLSRFDYPDPNADLRLEADPKVVRRA